LPCQIGGVGDQGELAVEEFRVCYRLLVYAPPVRSPATSCRYRRPPEVVIFVYIPQLSNFGERDDDRKPNLVLAGPVPMPAARVLFPGALCGLAALRRRRPAA